MTSGSLYDRFNLLPPPPASIFSHHQGPDRLRLPAFQNVAEAQDFLERMLVFRKSAVVANSSLAFGVLALVLLGFFFCIKAPLVYRRRLWLFRLVHTPEGTIILPCVNVCFQAFGAVFLLLNATCAFIDASRSDRADARPIERYPLWLLLQFVPIWLAACAQAWSNSLSRVVGSEHYEVATFRDTSSIGIKLSPAARNFLWASLPLGSSFAVAIPAILASNAWDQAVLGRAHWLERYEGTEILTQELLVDLQKIWFELYRSADCVAIGFCLWFVLALSASVIYGILSFRLSTQLHQHLKALLHLKQSREIIATVRVEQTTVVMVSLLDQHQSRSVLQNPFYENASPRIAQQRGPHVGMPTKSDFFPAVAPTSARHQELGDGSGFQRVLLLHSAQSALMVVGITIFGFLALSVGLSVVDAIETNNLRHLQSWAFLSAQGCACLMGLFIILVNHLLDHSDLFLLLMHGDYHDGFISGIASKSEVAPLFLSPSSDDINLSAVNSMEAGDASVGHEHDPASKS